VRPSTTLGDAPIGKEGKQKVKTPNFQIEMRNPLFVVVTERRRTPFATIAFEEKKMSGLKN